MMKDDFLWVEKYRPHKIEDCILPESLKSTFSEFVKQGSIPNLLLTGSQGTGKTTVARAMCEELGLDYIEINGSMNGGIDTLRTEIKNFASTISFTGTRKMVILDEADYLNAQSTQPALRNFMEEFSKNCGFILTCNFKNRIIEPLHSRCSVIEFKIPSSQKPKLAAQFHKRACGILEQEGVEFDKAVVAEVVTKHFPDWRRVLNELQRYSVTGKIDSGILANLGEENFKGLVDLLKNKRFNDMRKWVSENLDTEPTAFFRKFYDMASTYMKPNSIPQLVLLLGRYQYQSAFVADQEINTVAFLTEVMVEAEWV
jgi:DNA polymerase III delta prime subunit